MATDGFPIYRELVTKKGATYQPFWVLQDDAGAYVDTTGYVAEMQVRENADDTDALATYTTTNGKLLVGQTIGSYTGCVMLNLSESDTDAFENGMVAYYDLFLTNLSGERDCFSEGPFCVGATYTERGIA